MKKAVKIISLALVVVIVGAMLASCSKMLSGTYTVSGDYVVVGTKTSLTFNGNKVTVTNTVTSIIGSTEPKDYIGTYEIKTGTDGTQTITFTFDEENDNLMKGTHTFEEKTVEGKKIIVIDKTEFIKK